MPGQRGRQFECRRASQPVTLYSEVLATGSRGCIMMVDAGNEDATLGLIGRFVVPVRVDLGMQ